MEVFRISGGKSLSGEIKIPTAKNSLLPLLACCVMCEENVILKECTQFLDVMNMTKILESLGVKSEFQGENLFLDCSKADKFYVAEEYTKRVRSSIFMLGPLLARFKRAKVAYPGGCNIGTRPIDLHLKGLRDLNVKIEERHGYILCDGANMKAGNIHLDFPSVGATENIMMVCAKLKGESKIYNCAREPEIEDLQNFLNSMGAKVSGAGTSTITIVGVEHTHKCEYKPIGDRIIAGTYMIAVAMAGGKVTMSNVIYEHNLALINKLRESGCKIEQKKGGRIEIQMSKRPHSMGKVETQPYPGFPTDLQSQVLTLQTISQGTCVIVENLLKTRFKIYTELIKMGADVTIRDRMAIVNGEKKLYGASVVSPDLRGGTSLVLAGLVAEGYTTVSDIEVIDRGYYHLENDLAQMGADIKRMEIQTEENS